jgi:hypothetical protein
MPVSMTSPALISLPRADRNSDRLLSSGIPDHDLKEHGVGEDRELESLEAIRELEQRSLRTQAET